MCKLGEVIRELFDHRTLMSNKAQKSGAGNDSLLKARARRSKHCRRLLKKKKKKK